MRRALAIDEQSYGAEHPHVAASLNELGVTLRDLDRLDEAEPLLRKALKIYEAHYGPIHPEVTFELSSLAQVLKATDRLDEAEQMMRRCLKITFASTEKGKENERLPLRIDRYRDILTRLGHSEDEIQAKIEFCRRG